MSAGDAGGEGPFSSVRAFSTLFPAPTLLSPAPGATGQPLSITLQWNKVNGALRYHLQLASDSAFTAFIKNDTTITDSVRLVPGLTNSTWYYWRVAAKTNTVTGPFSVTRTFRTIGVMPGAVTLVAPAMDSKFKPDSVRFTWRRATSATRYTLEVGLDSLFQVHLVDSTLTDSTKVVHGLLLNAKVWWKVRGGTAEGWGPFSEVRRLSMDGTTGLQANSEIPGSYALNQNYPNPFNPSTMIAYDLPAAGTMRLEVFNMLGESVGLLVDEYRTAGHHEVRFNADGLSSGTYFYRMTANGTVITRRMLLLR
ncbi:MAG: T9SS type A sorting domain-containing protein [Ignavibacteriae bacterium]|nr:T9SS type A sorting domain-containing protein [Ignavibacteriota bacterium]